MWSTQDLLLAFSGFHPEADGGVLEVESHELTIAVLDDCIDAVKIGAMALRIRRQSLTASLERGSS